MAFKYIIFSNLLIVTVISAATNTPEVYEKITEDESLLPENIRITRHPKFQKIHEPHNFDFKKSTQQDPQRLRYAQQQQIDSYMRAYHQEQATKRPQKHRKVEKNPSIIHSDQFTKTTYDTRPKSENRQPSLKQINFNGFPSVPITDQHPKKVDPIQLNKVPVIDNSREESTNDQKKFIVSREKALSKPKLSYQVSEEILDQETEPSSKHESRVYFGQEEILKTVQNYAAPLSPNYLAGKPTYVLANPQLNQLVLDPKVLNQAVGYTLPQNHQLSYAGFEPATKSDLDALSSLLGKSPNAQLHGLNELLNNQPGYAATAPAISIPDSQQVYAASAPAIPIPEPQQIVLKDVPIPVQSKPQTLVTHIKDHTPIKEEVFDVANTHVKQNVQTAVPQAQVKINTHTRVNHEQKLIRESKSIYGNHDDNVQYAAQYAFGYKIRDFHSGNNFGHEEIREGDVAKGHYHVLLPDGRLQNVEYWADPSGYHATVTYSNVAHH